MIVEINKPESTRFKLLSVGDVFTCGGEYYLKISNDTHEGINAFNLNRLTAVQITTDCIAIFKPSKLTIDY